MCGIFGFTHFDQNPLSQLKKMGHLMIHSGPDDDGYYTGIWNYLDDKTKKSIYYLPQILTYYEVKKYVQFCENSGYNFLFKHDYLKINDYLFSLYSSLKNIFRSLPKLIIFNNFDITYFAKNELLFNSSNVSYFQALLNLRFVNRLKKESVNVKLLIDWNEMQMIDKALCKGFKTYYSNTYIKGYQGMIAPYDYSFHLLSIPVEKELNLIPDKILVIGSGLKEALRKYDSSLLVEEAPAFRFKKIFEIDSESFGEGSVSNVLVGLPISMVEVYNILNIIKDIANTLQDIKFLIKRHPSHKLEKLILVLKPSQNIVYVEGDFYQWLTKSNIYMSANSTTCMEALALGKPVIIIGNFAGLPQNIISEKITTDIWLLCYTPEKIANAINFYTSLSLEKKEEHKKIGKKIREDYFEPVTKEGVYKFLDLSD